MRVAIRLFSYFALAAIVAWAVYNLYWDIRYTKTSMEYQKMQEDGKESMEQYSRDNLFTYYVDSLISLKQYAVAITQANQYAAIHPESKLLLDEAFVKIGNLYARGNQIDSALKMYSDAIMFSNVHITASVARGTLYYRAKNYKAALPDFEYAASENFDYYYDLGLIQQKLKRYQEADSSFTTYLHDHSKCEVCKLKIDTMERQIAKYKAVSTIRKHFAKADSVKKSPYSIYANKYHLDNH